ncbi:hypothetical protein K1719_044569 [Acacia pycnantha]|nr:hypothetical protein K1719_044569 [Acacia pycnantha]
MGPGGLLDLSSFDQLDWFEVNAVINIITVDMVVCQNLSYYASIGWLSSIEKNGLYGIVFSILQQISTYTYTLSLPTQSQTLVPATQTSDHSSNKQHQKRPFSEKRPQTVPGWDSMAYNDHTKTLTTLVHQPLNMKNGNNTSSI